MRLPAWMRALMFATAIVNIFGAIVFVPSMRGLRELVGFPIIAPPLYLTTLGAFILIFGLGFLWSGVTGTADRQFVAAAVAGKLSFFALLVRYWMAGLLPATAPLAGAADLVIASLFLVWLWSVRGAVAIDVSKPRHRSEMPPD